MENVESVKDVLTQEELVRERDFYDKILKKKRAPSKNTTVR